MAYQQIPGYPVYQQQYPPPYQDRLSQLQSQYQQTIPLAPQAINQGLLWVQGEAGAKSYLVAPSTTVLLMDSETERFYIKSTDGTGIPNLRTFEYREVLQSTPQHPQTVPEDFDNKYVTRAEYEGLKRQYDEIMSKLNSFNVSELADKPRTSKGKGGNTDE